MPAGFPLPLRNAIAELAIAAHEDDAAAAALAWLAAPRGTPSAAAGARLASVHLIDPGGRELLAVHGGHAAAVAAHAARACRAAAVYRIQPSGSGLRQTATSAAALWNEQLFFEVHEVLEAAWKVAAGAERQALQGVIQLAVAFHHLAHGNPRGARSLLREGRGRLASVPADVLPRLDLTALLDDTAAWERGLDAGAPPEEPPPRLGLRAQA